LPVFMHIQTRLVVINNVTVSYLISDLRFEHATALQCTIRAPHKAPWSLQLKPRSR
jgi:hypothetical protein